MLGHLKDESIDGVDIMDELMAMGIKEEVVGEAINFGSGKEHRVIAMANMVNELTGQTLRKFNHQTFKKGLIRKRCASCADARVKYVGIRDWGVKTRLLSSVEKAKKLLGYEPRMEFEDGLKRVHEQTFRKSLIEIENWKDIKKIEDF